MGHLDPAMQYSLISPLHPPIHAATLSQNYAAGGDMRKLWVVLAKYFALAFLVALVWNGLKSNPPVAAMACGIIVAIFISLLSAAGFILCLLLINVFENEGLGKSA